MPNESTVLAERVETRDVIRAAADLMSVVEPSLLRLWKETGLTLSQRRVLRQLRDAPRTAGAVAESLGLSAPALSRHLTALERRGLIDRQIDPADRRRVLIAVTAGGRKLLAGHHVFSGTPLQAAAAQLSPGERKATVEAISRLVALARETGGGA
jgi:DNA-binding MarR family transcriptional regulator